MLNNENISVFVDTLFTPRKIINDIKNENKATKYTPYYDYSEK